MYKIFILLFLFSSCKLSTKEYFLTFIKGEYQFIGSTNTLAINVNGDFQTNGVIFLRLQHIQSSNYAIYSTPTQQFTSIIFITNIIYRGEFVFHTNMINTNNIILYARKI